MDCQRIKDFINRHRLIQAITIVYIGCVMFLFSLEIAVLISDKTREESLLVLIPSITFIPAFFGLASIILQKYLHKSHCLDKYFKNALISFVIAIFSAIMIFSFSEIGNILSESPGLYGLISYFGQYIQVSAQPGVLIGSFFFIVSMMAGAWYFVKGISNNLSQNTEEA